MTKKKGLISSSDEQDENKIGYYGMDQDQSLLTVNFSTNENQYLSEHYQNISKDDENES